MPKEQVLLTVAADRLAEARRTAGQTDDDAKSAARAELRAEFYSGSMLATVVTLAPVMPTQFFPSVGLHEIALTWLEQGECLLTKGLVYPRLDPSLTTGTEPPAFP